MKIEIYNPSQKLCWDSFVEKSKNGHFIFFRDYLEYHKNRFNDFSLLVFDNHDKLIALLPGHKIDDVFASHNGLTYGGIIVDKSIKMTTFIQVFEKILDFLKKQNFTRCLYKTMPYIHHKIPAEEDRFILFTMGAKLLKRNLLSIRDQKEPTSFQERRNRCILKAKYNKLDIRISDDLNTYWLILTQLLEQEHNSKPVHNIEEIQYLRSKFPNNIKLYGCFNERQMLGGVLIFENYNVVRAQYIAMNPEGKKIGGLDLLFDQLIHSIYPEKRFVDFGSSEQPTQFQLNVGLLEQKEGFGARSIVHDQYEIEL